MGRVTKPDMIATINTCRRSLRSLRNQRYECHFGIPRLQDLVWTDYYDLLSEPGFSGLPDFQDLPHRRIFMCVCVLF